MYRIVPPFLGMICRVLAVAALLHLGMAHSQEVPSAASIGADGVQRVTIVGGSVELSAKAQVVHLSLKAGHYVFYRPFWFQNYRERGMAGVMEARG